MANSNHSVAPTGNSDDGGADIVDSAAFQSFLTKLQKSPTPVQLGAASVPGMISGYAAMKISKAVAIGVGGGLLVLFIGSRYGFITINDSKVAEALSEKKAELKRRKAALSKTTWRMMLEDLRVAAQQNPALSIGYICGFLVGLSYA